MYNRYVRNDAGVYERIPVEEYGPAPEEPSAPHPSSPPPPHTSGREAKDDKRGLLSGILSKLKLDDIDTGDLLLLAILFLLFKEGGDEELLIALGLLLIL